MSDLCVYGSTVDLSELLSRGSGWLSALEFVESYCFRACILAQQQTGVHRLLLP